MRNIDTQILTTSNTGELPEFEFKKLCDYLKKNGIFSATRLYFQEPNSMRRRRKTQKNTFCNQKNKASTNLTFTS